MSESSRTGPLIKRQGFVKRAPSGKLSAFKKWEKKWCVFALSRRSGPVLDFFESRADTDNGPAAAANRVELKTTKQVCAAIQCKVPHTFIIVTESRILSLAAINQSDAESWITCLRKVLTQENCLQSSEDHTYEVGGAGLTRQEQERQARAKRRPPTPPSESEDGAADDDGIPTEPPPVPPSLSSLGAASNPPPSLPQRAMKGPLPPPVPTTNRPRLHENDFTPIRSFRTPPDDDAAKNLQQVLQNYEETPDTTYESGDREVINRAAHTLDHRKLKASLLREQQFNTSNDSSAESSTLTHSAKPIDLYSKINKGNLDNNVANKKRPPVAPRRASTLARIEHDFSPALAVVSTGYESDDTTLGRGAAVPRHHVAAPCSSSDDESESMYTCMDSFADVHSDLAHIDTQHASAEPNHYDFEDDDEEEVAVGGGADGGLPISPPEENLYDQLPPPRAVAPATLTPQPPELPVKKVIHIHGKASTVVPAEKAPNIDENAKPVKEVGKGKAFPVVAPRRTRSERGPSGQVSAVIPQRVTRHGVPPIPSRREYVPNSDENQDEYENALGLFGSGVTSVKKAANNTTNQAGDASSKLSSTSPVPPQRSGERSSTAVKLETAQYRSIDSTQVPLPPLPEPNHTKRPQSTPSSTSAILTIDSTQSPSAITRATPKPGLRVDIPLADGESTDSSLSEAVHSPNSSSRRANQSEDGSLPRSEEHDLRNHLGSVHTANATLPSDEAPPPYTPPRLLNDTQLSNNMDCIAEGNSEEEAEAGSTTANHTQSRTNVDLPIKLPINNQQQTMHTEEPLYDSHPAFIRNITSLTSNQTNNKQDRKPTISKSPTVTTRKLSPHTPPGTPPLFAQLHTPSSKLTLSTPPAPKSDSPVDDIVHRLEDSFPRMKQRNLTSRRHSYLDEVVMSPSSDTTSSRRSAKSAMRKSFSVLPSSHRNGDKSKDVSDAVKPRLSASTDELKPTVAEYDHVIRRKALIANKKMVRAGSSSDDSDPGVVQRRPHRSVAAEARQRRKSAPPNSLDMRLIVAPSAAPVAAPRTPTSGSDRPTATNTTATTTTSTSSSTAPKASGARPVRERRYSRLPLSGGTLLMEGKVFKAPQRDANPTNIPLKQAQTELLQQEIAHSYGVNVTVWRKELKYVLFVEIMGNIWVAGWNQKERPLLHNIFHIGDKILSVNNMPYTSTPKLVKYIKRSDSDAKFEIIVRRLPFGKAYFIHRNLDYEDIGLGVKDGTAEVTEIKKGSLVALQGLRINPNRAFGTGQCHWVVTEVNHRPLTLIAPESEAKARLAAVGKDVTFVVQPLDFVELLKKALKSATFSWKDYLVS